MNSPARAYETSHPWLTFHVDLRRAPLELFLDLGRAAAMGRQVAAAPLRPAVAAEIHQVYLAKGVMATTAIEGNTLTEEQVLGAVRGELRLPPSKAYLRQEVDNIIDVCNHLAGQVIAKTFNPGITPDEVDSFNARVLHNLEVEDDVVPGEIRQHSVTVGGVYRGAPAEDCEYLVDRLCAWISDLAWPGREDEIAILRAILAHLYLAWIHPYGDGNGRTARLVEVKLLAASGLPTPVAHLLSNHYNQTRAEYYRQLNRASKSGGDVWPFVHYALQGFVDGLRMQFSAIERELIDVSWRNYVYEQFRRRRKTMTESDQRRRQLLLDLSDRDRGMAWRHELPLLSERLSRLYASKTPKTLTRDLNFLKKQDLIVEVLPGLVQARKWIVQAFKPVSADDNIDEVLADYALRASDLASQQDGA